eukprot:CAMPEP_0114669102 /NCGR_PEP_ID=MMETSP0191-20121206/37514_2 /TAXON_ID=126664 /ORGANISM="Sorites sp." /LENGTH=60 /DNA_ID=CAMNT_0001923993 /DNA_START=314 /DNA_END=493 /DNA_ORIENTATION=-
MSPPKAGQQGRWRGLAERRPPAADQAGHFQPLHLHLDFTIHPRALAAWELANHVAHTAAN